MLAALFVSIGIFGIQTNKHHDDKPLPKLIYEPDIYQIAYVSNDKHIHIIQSDGLNDRRISPLILGNELSEGVFTWPTWAPNGEKLAFSGIDTTYENMETSLFIYNISNSKISKIYTDTTDKISFLAPGVLHYANWAPDSNQIAFIATTSQGVTLFLDDLTDDKEAEFVLTEGPLWSSWSPNSRHLLIHRGNDHFLIDTIEDIKISQLDIDSMRYRVPDWRPSDSFITIASETGSNEYTIYTSNIDTSEAVSLQAIAIGQLEPAFSWAPNGDFLALAQSSRLLMYANTPIFMYQELSILPQNEINEPIHITDNIISYFWSPDSSKLAYITPSSNKNALQLMILNINDGFVTARMEFTPSIDQLTVFQFFDQYARSHSIWSPDSVHLILAGRPLSQSVFTDHSSKHNDSSFSPSISQSSYIMIVNTDVNSSITRITNGTLGFWSPN